MWDNNEHVDRGDVAHVVLNEGTPARGRDFGAPGHVSANRGLAGLDAEFEQLTVDARRAPADVVVGHLPDEGANLGILTRPPSPFALLGGWDHRSQYRPLLVRQIGRISLSVLYSMNHSRELLC